MKLIHSICWCHTFMPFVTTKFFRLHFVLLCNTWFLNFCSASYSPIIRLLQLIPLKICSHTERIDELLPRYTGSASHQSQSASATLCSPLKVNDHRKQLLLRRPPPLDPPPIKIPRFPAADSTSSVSHCTTRAFGHSHQSLKPTLETPSSPKSGRLSHRALRELR